MTLLELIGDFPTRKFCARCSNYPGWLNSRSAVHVKEENKTLSKNVTKNVLMIKTMALSTCARSKIQQRKFSFCEEFSHLVYSPDTPKKICQEMFHAVAPGTCWLVQNCTYPGRGVCSLLRAEGFYEKRSMGSARPPWVSVALLLCLGDLWSFFGYFITERSFVFVI